MFTVEECKKVLRSKGAKYTDEEVEKIREALHSHVKMVNEAYTSQNSQNNPTQKKKRK
ncbi:hypothetical protein [Flavobacterium cyanobacteriorum]|uniref:hypothetical protein n=1 Tax=Flavobacterium cyanobacteriorum TaxID=2022802 RepID=UPI0013FD7A10|nr:hypothetical protein [Flavobacterium cyanobacteriorum]